MPVGLCTECGQDQILGKEPDDGEPFLCCDCDSEMCAYSAKDRSDMKRASRERMEKLSMVVVPGSKSKRSSMLDAARTALPSSPFDPEGDRSSAIKIMTDNEQDYFAGLGSAEVGPSCVTLALYMQEVIGAEAGLSVLEVGAGCGAPSIWMWKKRHPQLKVTVSDVPRLVPLLQLNMEANMAVDKIVAKPLRWGVQADAKAFDSTGEVFDWVVGADAAVNEEKSYPLMETLIWLNPRKGAIFAQTIHPEHRGDGENSIEALKERAKEAGWRFDRVKDMPTGVKFRDEEFITAICLILPPSTGVTRRKSRHSKFDGEDLSAEELAATMAALDPKAAARVGGMLDSELR